ncbi:MAG: Glutamate-1-semialdehyde 2,1-aminomutase [Chlamydiales bacterium]|nr:Glutamate-1-semialdehyde 2,1-aminomutase [Chlamydiales bacterium]
MTKTSLTSQEIYHASCQFIPGGVNSPVRAFPGLNQTPLVVQSGQGDTILDVDGTTYIDFCCSWGALIHGHAHPAIVEVAQRQVAKGSSFGITTEVEAKLAHLITESVPSVEKVRFVSSGTEATMSAARLARGFTKRDLLLKFAGHYHGHADSFLIQAGSGAAHLASSAGVPEDFVKHTLCLPYNDFDACREVFQTYGERIAGLILEPIAANMGVIMPKEGFLEMLREETQKVGALLIFDEVITGFRVALGGAQELYGIEPDLTCFGKIVGGGFPAAAFGGKAEIMDHLAPIGAVYQAGTLSGNPVAMEAGLQALKLCAAPGFYQTLQEKTDSLTAPIRAVIEEGGLKMRLHQVGSLFTLFFGGHPIHTIEDVKRCDQTAFVRFFQALYEQGIYVSPSQFEANFLSSAHSDTSLNYTRECMVEWLSISSPDNFKMPL